MLVFYKIFVYRYWSVYPYILVGQLMSECFPLDFIVIAKPTKHFHELDKKLLFNSSALRQIFWKQEQTKGLNWLRNVTILLASKLPCKVHWATF
jgi:hypothetical protein